MTSKRESSDDELRRALKRGDPLLDAPLTFGEAAETRRSVLARMPLPPRQPFVLTRRPVVAAAGVALLLCLTALGIYLSTRPSTVARTRGDIALAATISDVHPAPALEATKPADGVAAPRVVPRASRRQRAVRTADKRDAPALRPQEDAAPRQIQFTTPGGTRVIWVLDQNFRLPSKPLLEEPPCLIH
jgi:hypothetical protein